MKPREDGEGVAMAKTSKNLTYPNMTQDEPERVKEIRQRQYDRRKLAEDRGADVGNNHLYGDIDALLSIISVSEKRAEEAERERDAIRTEQEQWDQTVLRLMSVRDSSQASLLRVVEALKSAAEVIGVGIRAIDEGVVQSVVITIGDATADWLDVLRLCEAKVRTALSPHTEK